MEQFAQRYWETWFNEPIPMLNGQSPVQAASNPHGRHLLEQLFALYAQSADPSNILNPNIRWLRDECHRRSSAQPGWLPLCKQLLRIAQSVIHWIIDPLLAKMRNRYDRIVLIAVAAAIGLFLQGWIGLWAALALPLFGFVVGSCYHFYRASTDIRER